MIEQLSKKTNITIYGAIDPYRQSIKKELNYMNEKKDLEHKDFLHNHFLILSYLKHIFHISKMKIYFGESAQY